MAHLLSRSRKMAPVLAGTAAIGLGLWLVPGLAPASAAPAFTAALGVHVASVEPVRFYRRHYPPVYPYYYNPGRPGGTSVYFGFMPYARGNYEIQALQRQFPETNWPPSMRYWTPQVRDNN
jgi:hypothetical protein